MEENLRVVEEICKYANHENLCGKSVCKRTQFTGLLHFACLWWPGLQKDGNGGNVFPANLRFWQPLLASQLKLLQK